MCFVIDFFQHNVFKVHLCSSIPFYGSTILHCIDIPYFVCPFISEGYMGRFHLWTITDNATENINVQVFVWIYAFISLRCIARSGIAGS